MLDVHIDAELSLLFRSLIGIYDQLYWSLQLERKKVNWKYTVGDCNPHLKKKKKKKQQLLHNRQEDSPEFKRIRRKKREQDTCFITQGWSFTGHFHQASTKLHGITCNVDRHHLELTHQKGNWHFFFSWFLPIKQSYRSTVLPKNQWINQRCLILASNSLMMF